MFESTCICWELLHMVGSLAFQRPTAAAIFCISMSEVVAPWEEIVDSLSRRRKAEVSNVSTTFVDLEWALCSVPEWGADLG